MQHHPGTLSKSDFRLFLDAPRHLWAGKHGLLQEEISPFAELLIRQGYTVEELAREYLSQTVLATNPGWRLDWQRTCADGPFHCRVDALIYKPAGCSYDLYEIKSGTGVDKEHLYDVAFQALVLSSQFKLDRLFILHLNKEYTLAESLDLTGLFLAEDISEQVAERLPEVELLRQSALQAALAADPAGWECCLDAKTCPCPQVCHPDLPEFSIFDIPRLSKPKKIQLLQAGIRAARDIPPDFGLNPKQELVRQRAATNTAHLNRPALRAELERFEFPLYFLDYETCLVAVPRYPGYHPQQQVVFQYSLHRLDAPRGELSHNEHLSAACEEPSISLVEQLSRDLGPRGTVIVWNKAFEMSRNREMAMVSPQYAGFLDALNQRIYDLGEIVNQGYYLHPGFKGSWSIKHVLPVMVPELGYEELTIRKGDQASAAWWQICFGEIPEGEKECLKAALLSYCKLDTLAMVEIYRRLYVLAYQSENL